jgi:hypothetical protein
MVLSVSDTSSNRRDQISNFAEILRNSPSKQIIFNAVYHGKKHFKTVEEIAQATHFSTKRVTELAKPLARGERLFEQGREMVRGRMQTVYRKLDFVETNKRKILRLAKNSTRLNSYHTKTNPAVHKSSQRIVIHVPFKSRFRFITVDEINQFKKVEAVRSVPTTLHPARLSEGRIKAGLRRILGATESQKDWGGESNDIFARVTIGGHSRRAAFALKGPGQTGTLVPRKMGKNGDQIQRLFDSPADVFFVQYEGEIAQSIVSLMENLASAKAILRGEVLFGIIDRNDTYRLRLAYPSAFRIR